MSGLGEHWAFIFGAYGAAAVVTLGIIFWTILDARRQRARLTALESQGIRRRSDPAS
jgi:heme exporter protein D